MMLLKDEWIWASPNASTLTFFFFLTDLAIVLNLEVIGPSGPKKLRLLSGGYFFLFATVLRRPFRVRELFFVR